MELTNGTSKLIIEHYPYNKYIVVKQRENGESIKIGTRRFSVVEGSTDAHLLQHAFRITYSAEAIYGKISLYKHSYLIVVEKSKLIGRVLGNPVFQVQKVHFINLTKDADDGKDNSSQRNESATDHAKTGDDLTDETAIQMLTETLDSGSVYYSDNYHLTNNMQNQLGEQAEQGFDPAFCINGPYVKKFAALKGAEKFCTGFILGYFVQKDLFLKTGRVATFTIISRKQVERLGTRFYSRGIDADGFVSNFVETETILEITETEGAKRVYSHVQIRGSIPLFWSQRPTLKYTPSIELGKSEQANEHAMTLHFRRLLKRYFAVQCINLIDKQGSQLSIGSAFERVFGAVKEANPDLSGIINLQWFDYHKECRGGKMNKIRDLLDFIKVDTANYGLFSANVTAGETSFRWKVTQTQKGVIRTNCIDCLDRTNVMQSVVSRQTFHSIFAKLGLEAEGVDPLAPLPEFFEPAFREFWTGNANTMSRLYAGTDALKTDVTRTGKRTYKGLFDDGKNSVVRYFINNLADHHRQNSYGLLTDQVKPEQLVNYRKRGVNDFLAKVAILALLPLILYIFFKIMGLRTNSGLIVFVTILSTMVAFLYIQDKKNGYLKGDLVKH